ncbi:LLM class flavin-dependent oxidoreductase [Mycolicibacterium sp. BiH015]|uniref:LLM class flavin-dependent oxidoreductase n=1 Tax=Mycolicibacterium sp. BiH015 TaxID=3018808 RepID=UPI0022E015F0|nr:LLM class flavin-dependent oxidoreductase [Mycolicibacterium sp. BiH015]MDA2893283.1 LLM class flavin-dependent oxidoreductase [Mycolicibacterium sp. BiH015]
MKLGVGLPTTIPGTTAEQTLQWASSAERLGFSTLGTLDRLAFDNYDPVPVLAAAAAVTHRIGLATSILIAPYRGNGAVLAKQLASIDRLSGGRLTVGIAVGTREDDYSVTGTDYSTRGKVMDDLLLRMHALWEGAVVDGGRIGPPPTGHGKPPLLIGGGGKSALRRVVQHGSGWISGGGGVEAFKQTADAVRAAWLHAGRNGSPRLVSLGYFALGANAREAASRYLGQYYGFSGQYAEHVIANALTSSAQIEEEIGAFSAAGCDELILFPCLPDPDQVDLLAAIRPPSQTAE